MPRSIITQFKSLLHDFQHVFHLPDSPLSTIKGVYHHIPTGDSPPVYRLPYRKSPAELSAIKAEIARMLKLNIVHPSNSAWGAPCILVRKPLEKGKPQPPRFVVDYRGLNAVTSSDGYPIPSVANILDAISGGKIFAKLDLASGYWQLAVNPKDRHKTAFATHLGLWEFIKITFGLKTAPQTFQRVLNTVFSDYLYQGSSSISTIVSHGLPHMMKPCGIIKRFLNAQINFAYSSSPLNACSFLRISKFLATK